MRELFVYYKVTSNNAPGARQAVLAMHTRLRLKHPRLTTRLLCRPEETDGQQTWMETYSAAPDGVDVVLQQAIEDAAAAVGPWTAGPRHTEVFIACAS